jgi:hypothetical protein
MPSWSASAAGSFAITGSSLQLFGGVGVAVGAVLAAAADGEALAADGAFEDVGERPVLAG